MERNHTQINLHQNAAGQDLANSSAKERVIAERIRFAELKAEASFVERKHATEYEAEALRIQEQMAKAEARAKFFEMMDQ